MLESRYHIRRGREVLGSDCIRHRAAGEACDEDARLQTGPTTESKNLASSKSPGSLRMLAHVQRSGCLQMQMIE